VASFTLRPLYLQGKNPWYPLNRRLGGPQSLSGRGGEKKNSQPLQGYDPPIIQNVAQPYTTELSRLLSLSLSLGRKFISEVRLDQLLILEALFAMQKEYFIQL
jgi:hypothetical protein